MGRWGDGELQGNIDSNFSVCLEHLGPPARLPTCTWAHLHLGPILPYGPDRAALVSVEFLPDGLRVLEFCGLAPAFPG
ncbi:hypothetical protein MiSe_20120 [Microseira wollei NIES-4236]|uniref:Uncharacterized protein n=1 Tax=Microseira wollei NIES-4236 TaxID=2530354 RepID=A0AAV3XA44_9CYAN|nr:hypothetical protein MiSe_20120 [Microseira wollei NIES-4236]